jgi:hypothetical protein
MSFYQSRKVRDRFDKDTGPCETSKPKRMLAQWLEAVMKDAFGVGKMPKSSLNKQGLAIFHSCCHCMTSNVCHYKLETYHLFSTLLLRLSERSQKYLLRALKLTLSGPYKRLE